MSNKGIYKTVILNLGLRLQIVFLFPFVNSIAQIPTVQWTAKYGNNSSNSIDEAFQLAIDNAGNVIVIGKTVGISSYNDFGTVKYDANGTKLWDTTYNGPANGTDEAHFISVDDSGNVYVCGKSGGSGTGYDYCTIKYNPAGIPMWISRYNWTNNQDDIPTGLFVDKRGYIYVTGYSFDTVTGYDYATIKYNPNGTPAWTKRFNSTGILDDEAFGISVDDSGYVYVTGTFYKTGTSDYNFGTIKYDSSGTIKWVKEYQSPVNDYDQGVSIVVGDSGFVYVTGISNQNINPGLPDYLTIKYNSIGDSLWVKRYDNGSDDLPTSLAIDKKGNVYVTGWSRPYPSPDSSDYLTIKYAPNGIQLWVSRFKAGGGAGIALTLDKFGSVYVTGGASPGGFGSNDYWTVKYDSLGNEKWRINYNGAANVSDGANSIVVDTLGNVFVTGRGLEGNPSNYQYVTIKYSQTNSISELSDLYSISFYPNPFSSTAQIDISPPINNADLMIFDLLGNEVKKINFKSSPVDILRDNLSNGIYFYRIISKTQIITNGKMIIN